MKRSFFIVAGLALGAFVLVYILLESIIQPRPVVVAKTDLAAGTRLTANLLDVRELPAGGVPEGAYKTLEEAEGKVLTTARVSGDPITAYVAGESNAAAGIPAQLALNCVAISIKVDQATGLAGVVRPGQRVTVIGVVDPGQIPQNNLQSLSSPITEPPAVSISGATPIPPPPTPTPQPPASAAARVVITGLKVLVVPQTFRYEEVPVSDGLSDTFAPARTTSNMQQGSVILLEAPLTPVEVAPGLVVSPAELLALLNQTAVIHLALEPAEGLSIRVEALDAVDLARLYESMTGYSLTP